MQKIDLIKSILENVKVGLVDLKPQLKGNEIKLAKADTAINVVDMVVELLNMSEEELNKELELVMQEVSKEELLLKELNK
ncbi:MAG: hypothetical protein MJ236_04765 [Clostridia bacterium]|nr:hypothetical protein [Clostridia bacterium]